MGSVDLTASSDCNLFWVKVKRISQKIGRNFEGLDLRVLNQNYPHVNSNRWVCLKIVYYSVLRKTQSGFADHYPVFKWLAIIGNINPAFSDIAR